MKPSGYFDVYEGNDGTPSYIQIKPELADKTSVKLYTLPDIKQAIIQACAEQREEYADLMDEAADDVAGWGAYASEYFQEKHRLEEEVKKWQDRAAAIRGQT